jgi:hypothetical protein
MTAWAFGMTARGYLLLAQSGHQATEFQCPLLGVKWTMGVERTSGSDVVVCERPKTELKFLRGTPPGELPVEFPTKMTLSINLKTAKALGIAVPPKLLDFADEVIE